MPEEVQIDDLVRLRKPHPCGSYEWRVVRVGADIGIGQGEIDRAGALLAAGADVIVLDSAHGHSSLILQTLRELKQAFPDAQVIAGNVVTAQAAHDLIDAGADAVKVGVGPLPVAVGVAV